jgi:serine/threonine-protein kinase
VLAGKYRVEKVVGAGGVGVVVSATHLALGEGVAIKLLQRSSQSTENLLRFEREARALARVKSDHVARVMDTGTLATGEPFLVMELLEGEDFGALAKREGKIAISRAVDYLVQACEAVVQAHARGIVHRDLKPANLFLTTDAAGGPRVKVLDFGISKLKSDTGVEAQAVTQTLSVIGSPLYMSPEQMQTPRDADELSDVWSLAVILHELVTGRPPFEAPTLPLLCAKICTAPATRLRDALEDAPEALEAILVRALDKDKARRHPSVAAFALAIAPFGTRASSALSERIARIAQAEHMSLDALADGSPDSIGRRLSWSSSPPPASESPRAIAPPASVPEPKPRQREFKLAIGALAFGLVCALIGAAWGQRTAAAPAVRADRGVGAIALQGDAVGDQLAQPAGEDAAPPTASPSESASLVASAAAAASASAATSASAGVSAAASTAAPVSPQRPRRPSPRVSKQGDVFSER